MRLAIHQPHYMPWFGYLRKIQEADIFVYLDKVAYEKHGFQNRNRFVIDGREHWLTIPVLTKGRMGQPIMDVKVNKSIYWVAKHRRIFLHNYKEIDKNKTETLDNFFRFDSDRLVDWSVRSVDLLCDIFGINTERISESALGIEVPYPPMAKTKSEICTGRIIRICKELGADIYLSGASRKDYIDEKLFGDIVFEYMEGLPESTLSAFHFYLKNEMGVLENKIRGEL